MTVAVCPLTDTKDTASDDPLTVTLYAELVALGVYPAGKLSKMVVPVALTVRPFKVLSICEFRDSMEVTVEPIIVLAAGHTNPNKTRAAATPIPSAMKCPNPRRSR